MTALLQVVEPELWVGYIRVSTWNEEKISPEIQEDALRAWAIRTGRRLADPLVVDLDATGRNFNRKIQGAIERVERREAKGIAVWRFSRFGRNRVGNNVNLARLESVGGQLESATEPVDARTALGELQREMIFAFGNYESNRAGEQWRETHEVRLKNQLPATGRARFGYVWHPRRVPDPTAPTGWRLQDERYTLHQEYASVAEEMFERKLAKPVPQGFNTIGHWLNEELRVTTLRGGLWHTSTISRYMDSGFAAGYLLSHDRECTCGYGKDPKQSKCANGRMLYLPGAQPKIIEDDVWEEYKAHRKLTKNKPPRTRKATYTLTGLLRHGYCRHHISHASATQKGVQVPGHWLVCSRNKNVSKIACPQGINASRKEVEDQVFDWLGRVAPKVDALPVIPGQTTAPKEDPRVATKRERAWINTELKKVEAALDRLVEDNAMDPDKYPADAFDRVRNKFVAKKGALTKQLAALGEAEATPQREDFQPLIDSLLAEWESFTNIERNAMLETAIRRVVVHDIRSEDSRFIKIRTEVHPVWEPDPWEPKKICRGPFGTRAGWLSAALFERPAEFDIEHQAQSEAAPAA